MLTLIKEDVYLETLALIDGIKEPDPILKGMQEYYASFDIKLYNIYEGTVYGPDRVGTLTDKIEGCTRYLPGLETFDVASWNEYKRLCTLHGKDTSSLKNTTLGTGFYFDRIWRTELIGRAGPDIKSNIELQLKDFHDKHMVINSGLGSVTVFEDTHISRALRYSITQEAKKIVKQIDPHDICRDEKVVVFDTLENLNKHYDGSLKEYYM